MRPRHCPIRSPIRSSFSAFGLRISAFFRAFGFRASGLRRAKPHTGGLILWRIMSALPHLSDASVLDVDAILWCRFVGDLKIVL